MPMIQKNRSADVGPVSRIQEVLVMDKLKFRIDFQILFSNFNERKVTFKP